MSWLDGLRHRARALLRPGAYQRELDEEMAFHLELDAMQQGGDAARARRRFGSRAWYAEEARRTTWLGALDVVRQDARHAWRSLRRDPGVVAAVVLTLALGVGVNAATFSLLDRLYLRPPPGAADPGSLRRIWLRHFNTEDGLPFASTALSFPAYREIAAAAPDSAALALYTTDYALRQGPSLADPRVRGVFASASYWPVLGVRPALGRVYTADEDRPGEGANVAVVSHDFWRTRLGGDSAALGRALAVGARTYTVIGVLPRDFVGLDFRPSDVWIPLGAMPAPPWVRGGRWWESDQNYQFQAVQRVPPGGAPAAAFEERASARLRRHNTAWHPQRPDTLTQVLVGPVIEARGPATPGQELVIATRLGGVAAIVLVIACANVVNLLLARAVRRRRDIAVRLALGISRARLIRLIAAESVLLAALAGVGALLACAWWGDALRTLLIENAREWREPALDARAALFTVAVALLAGLAAGLVPAVQASRPDMTAALKEGGPRSGAGRSRLRAALVVTQAALSVVLLVGAGLFVRSLRNVRALDIGFDAERLLFGEAEFDDGRRPADAVLEAGLRETAERLRARPGVEVVARAGMQPMRGFSFVALYADADSVPGAQMPTMTTVTPSFFAAAGIPFLAGRTFAGGGDGTGAEVVVNRAMADQLWPGLQALGQCLRFEARTNPCYTVVGVVETVRRDRVIEPVPRPQYYLPLGHMPVAGWHGETVVVRAGAEPGAGAAAAAELRATLRRTFPGAQATVTPMSENLEPEYRPWRLGARLFTWLGLLALAVALVGMYSTVSYAVTQRMHEFSVRVALGARVRDVLRHVLGDGLRTAALGVALGVVLALAAGRLVAALLYGVAPGDPLVLGAVVAALLAGALAAALVPAWRAARADPIAALRSE
ncbi:MAG TPA: ADOP family duplicated permease [Gemmatimonadaceae bacterium]|nr:ADOP family duplicated permease [Gemmatimonadaceae bacterium]